MTLHDLLPILPLITTLTWAVLLLVVDLFVPPGRKAITAGLAALGFVASLTLTLLWRGAPATAMNGMVVMDGFATLLNALFAVCGLAGVLFAYAYLQRMGIERGEYYVLLLFTVSGMMLMASAADLITIFLALELLSIPLYVLAGIARPRLASEEAALKYFLLGAFATGMLVYGIALVYGAAGSTQLSVIAAQLSQMTAAGNVPLIAYAGGGLILVGLSFKVGAVPFHMWTPDVYEGAPTPVAGFMSVAAKAGGFAALLRLLAWALPAMSLTWVPIVATLSALTMIVGNLAALVQTNLKRLLAYSSIAHAGYILMAVAALGTGTATAGAIAAALFYLLAYAVTNLGAWAVVVALEREYGTGLTPQDYAGLGRKHPLLALAMTVFMLSLTGIPPTAGLIAKVYVFRAALDGGLMWLAIIGVITSFISAYYYLRVLVAMYMREGSPEVHLDRLTAGVVAVAAVATLLLGLLPAPLMKFAVRAVMLAAGR
jgi:NADH-quinone oxidoreductase subunit N